MRRIQGVSLPRSGHSLMLNYLMRYFSRDLDWISNVDHWLTDGLMYAKPFVYCESYSHCHQVPCPHPDTTFQKDHDFNSTIAWQPDKFYLVQNRHPLPAIISHYNLSLSKLPKQKRFFRKWWRNPYDSARTWRRFFLERLEAWSDFQQKWVNPARPNVFVLDYELNIQCPESNMRKVIRFLDPEGEIDEQWFDTAIRSLDIISRDTITTFKYYDDWVQETADKVVDRNNCHSAA